MGTIIPQPAEELSEERRSSSAVKGSDLDYSSCCRVEDDRLSRIRSLLLSRHSHRPPRTPNTSDEYIPVLSEKHDIDRFDFTTAKSVSELARRDSLGLSLQGSNSHQHSFWPKMQTTRRSTDPCNIITKRATLRNATSADDINLAISDAAIHTTEPTCCSLSPLGEGSRGFRFPGPPDIVIQDFQVQRGELECSDPCEPIDKAFGKPLNVTSQPNLKAEEELAETTPLLSHRHDNKDDHELSASHPDLKHQNPIHYDPNMITHDVPNMGLPIKEVRVQSPVIRQNLPSHHSQSGEPGFGNISGYNHMLSPKSQVVTVSETKGSQRDTESMGNRSPGSSVASPNLFPHAFQPNQVEAKGVLKSPLSSIVFTNFSLPWPKKRHVVEEHQPVQESQLSDRPQPEYRRPSPDALLREKPSDVSLKSERYSPVLSNPSRTSPSRHALLKPSISTGILIDTGLPSPPMLTTATGIRKLAERNFSDQILGSSIDNKPDESTDKKSLQNGGVDDDKPRSSSHASESSKMKDLVHNIIEQALDEEKVPKTKQRRVDQPNERSTEEIERLPTPHQTRFAEESINPSPPMSRSIGSILGPEQYNAAYWGFVPVIKDAVQDAVQTAVQKAVHEVARPPRTELDKASGAYRKIVGDCLAEAAKNADDYLRRDSLWNEPPLSRHSQSEAGGGEEFSEHQKGIPVPDGSHPSITGTKIAKVVLPSNRVLPRRRTLITRPVWDESLNISRLNPNKDHNESVQTELSIPHEQPSSQALPSRQPYHPGQTGLSITTEVKLNGDDTLDSEPPLKLGGPSRSQSPSRFETADLSSHSTKSSENDKHAWKVSGSLHELVKKGAVGYAAIPARRSSINHGLNKRKWAGRALRKHPLENPPLKASSGFRSVSSLGSLKGSGSDGQDDGTDVESLLFTQPVDTTNDHIAARKTPSEEKLSHKLTVHWFRELLSSMGPNEPRLTTLPLRTRRGENSTTGRHRSRTDPSGPVDKIFLGTMSKPVKPKLEKGETNRGKPLPISETFSRTINDLEHLLNEALLIARQAADREDANSIPGNAAAVREGKRKGISDRYFQNGGYSSGDYYEPHTDDISSMRSIHESLSETSASEGYDERAELERYVKSGSRGVTVSTAELPTKHSSGWPPTGRVSTPIPPKSQPPSELNSIASESQERKRRSSNSGTSTMSSNKEVRQKLKRSRSMIIESPSKPKAYGGKLGPNPAPEDTQQISTELSETRRQPKSSKASPKRVSVKRDGTWNDNVTPPRSGSRSGTKKSNGILNQREVREHIKVYKQPPIAPRTSSLVLRKQAEKLQTEDTRHKPRSSRFSWQNIEHEHDVVVTPSAHSSSKMRNLEPDRVTISSVQSLDGQLTPDEVDFDTGYVVRAHGNAHKNANGGEKQQSVELNDPPLPQKDNSGPRRRPRPRPHHLFNLRGTSHVSLRENQKGFSLSNTHKRQPIARDWSPTKKRFVASVVCISTALNGVLVGIYAGEVPAIQYYIVDFHHYTILGNVFLFIGLSIPTFLFWPLPLLHGRKPYILGAMSLAMPLLFPQAVAVSQFRSPYVAVWRIGLLLPRAVMGFVLGFANMNLQATLMDLFGASLQSANPHQEIVDEADVRRHGGGMGIWLGLWTWCSIGSIGIGFMVGAIIINHLTPSWGFYISIAIAALVLFLNVVTPEVRRSAFRRSVVEVKTDTNHVSRRLARGEVMMHRVQTGPRWWGQEFHHGFLLSLEMIRQPGFLVLSLYCAWIYGQIVLVIILLGSLTSNYYKFRSPYVGASVVSVPLGAFLSIPFQKAGLFSRSRRHIEREAFEQKLSWSSHLVRRAIFTLTLPFAGLAYTLSSGGPPTPFMLPIVFAGLIGFLSNLAIAECNGIVMETFDTSDLQPGMTGRPRGISGERTAHKRTNYSSFPRVTAGFAITQGLGFLLAAVTTGIGGVARRHLGQQAATGVMAGILLILTLLLLAVLLRFKVVQIIPDSKTEDMERWAAARRISVAKEDDEPWRPVIIGNPTDTTRRMSILELGGMSRWSEIRKRNRLVDKLSLEAKHPNLAALSKITKSKQSKTVPRGRGNSNGLPQTPAPPQRHTSTPIQDFDVGSAESDDGSHTFLVSPSPANCGATSTKERCCFAPPLMAATGFVHHIGTFLLFAATVLLIITTISAPVVNDIALLKVKLQNSTHVSFGTFGYCLLDSPTHGHDYCTGSHVGYNPALIMSNIDATTFDRAATDTTKALTRVMILHPIACGVSFIAFLLALGSGFCGALLASLVSAVAWLITLIVMATDFALFGIIKHHVNKDGSGAHATYSVAMWTILAAMILLFFATFVVLFSCCRDGSGSGGTDIDAFLEGEGVIERRDIMNDDVLPVVSLLEHLLSIMLDEMKPSEGQAAWLATERLWRIRLGDNWHRTQVFTGRSSDSIIGVWELQDPRAPPNRLTKIVVKQALPAETMNPLTNAPCQGLKDEDAINRILKKAHTKHVVRAYRHMHEDAGANCHVLADRLGNVQRLYYEFCPGGDLTSFLHYVVAHEPLDEENGETDDIFVVFISHFDTEHQRIPIFKLGNFGVAKDISQCPIQDDGFEMDLYRGDMLWQAPEVRALPDRDSPQQDRHISSATNIWSVGQIMHILITQNETPIPPEIGDLGTCDLNEKLKAANIIYGKQLYDPNSPSHIYSPGLRALVLECLLKETQDRPTTKDLQLRTTDGLERYRETALEQIDYPAWADIPRRPPGDIPPPEWEQIDSKPLISMVVQVHCIPTDETNDPDPGIIYVNLTPQPPATTTRSIKQTVVNDINRSLEDSPDVFKNPDNDELVGFYEASRLTFIFNGRVLRDDETFESIPIKNRSWVHALYGDDEAEASIWGKTLAEIRRLEALALVERERYGVYPELIMRGFGGISHILLGRISSEALDYDEVVGFCVCWGSDVAVRL
ncbi:hypothetical protein B7494_g3557 [Chlorociboria aeruginascens]|nr:hypothetical protein B7494_g3557 [Chlorociboria aeruginascens]